MNNRISAGTMGLFTILFGFFCTIFIGLKFAGGQSDNFIKLIDFAIGGSACICLISLVFYIILKHDENVDE